MMEDNLFMSNTNIYHLFAVRAYKNTCWKSLRGVDIQANNHQAKAIVY